MTFRFRGNGSFPSHYIQKGYYCCYFDLNQINYTRIEYRDDRILIGEPFKREIDKSQ